MAHLPSLLDSDSTIMRVRALRKELRLSKLKFAERFGLPFQTYAQWESKRRQPDRPTLLLLNALLENPEFIMRLSRKLDRPLLQDPLTTSPQP